MSPLRIADIRIFPLSLPLRHPIAMSGASYATAETMLVRLETIEGVQGWGEAPAAPLMTGDTVAGMCAELRRLSPMLSGAEIADLDQARIVLGQLGLRSPGASSALEMALLAALSEWRGVPLFRLLGTSGQRSLPLLYLLGNADTALDVDEAVGRYKTGHRIFKLKTGIDAVETEIARFRAVRAALPNDAALAVDANGGWSQDDARRFLVGIRPMKLAFLEQPLPPGQEIEAMDIAEDGGLAVSLDESVQSLDSLRAWTSKPAFGGASLKLIKFGGISGFMEAAWFCFRHGLSINASGKVAETSVASAALLHAVSAVGVPDWGVSITNGYLAQDVAQEPVLPFDGRVEPPSGIGLGVKIDERALEVFLKSPE